MLVDAHCHLIGSHLDKDNLQQVLDRALAAGVRGMVAVGTDLGEAPAVLDLAARCPAVRASLGVHPHEARLWGPESGAELTRLLMDPLVLFVGETGLDFHYDLSPREVQEEVFRAQIRIAREVGKPLMIHTREAGEATLRLLREEGAQAVRGIIHCFSEDLAFARGALDLGFNLSFSGILTFPKSGAIQEVAAWAPLDRIHVETDSPYLAPVPFRGRTNEPAHVVHVAAHLARLRGLAPERVAEATTRNLEALCGWSPSS
jgi:TatD DNase family protein